MLPGEGFFAPVANARPGPVAAAGERVVVVANVVLDEMVVGGVPVMLPHLGRGVGDNGGQEVARLPAVDARVVLIAVMVDVVAGVTATSSHLIATFSNPIKTFKNHQPRHGLYDLPRIRRQTSIIV